MLRVLEAENKINQLPVKALFLVCKLMPVYCILPWQRERGNLAHVSSCCCSNLCDPTPWTTALQASLSFISFWMLLKFMSVESMMPSNHLILCNPLLLPLIFPSNRIFPSELTLHIRWPSIGVLASASVLPMNIQG